jgi:hypothetical protein
MIVRLTQLARLVLAFEYILNPLNWWWKVLAYPSASDPPLSQTPPFVQAMIDTGFMFAGTKAVEVVTGLMLLTNLWVPLALVVAFPVTVGIWSVDFFLISKSLRAQLLGWSVLTLNAYLLFAYIRCFLPMLVARATPWTAEGTSAQSGAGGPLRRKQALMVLGIVAVVPGGITSAWLIAMVARQLVQ